MNIKAWVRTKPEVIAGNPNSVSYGGEDKFIPVTKIMCDATYERCYLALVHNPEINAPYDFKDQDGETWIRFCKSHNKNHKIPVLKRNQIIEV